MDMVKVLTLVIAAASAAPAADFSIQVGNPSAVVASGIVKAKGALMAVRAQDCAEGTRARFTGIAVRTNGTSRETATLAFVEATPAGSFAVVGGWPAAEARPWLAVITADCLGGKAGALVPINAQGSYVREASRFFNHAPTDTEIEAALKTIAGGSR